MSEGQPAEPRSLHDLPVDIAIRLRWVLRDIAPRLGAPPTLLAPGSDLFARTIGWINSSLKPPTVS